MYEKVVLLHCNEKRKQNTDNKEYINIECKIQRLEVSTKYTYCRIQIKKVTVHKLQSNYRTLSTEKFENTK